MPTYRSIKDLFHKSSQQHIPLNPANFESTKTNDSPINWDDSGVPSLPTEEEGDASGVPSLPTEEQPASQRPQTAVRSPGGGSVLGSVKEMQQAILNFSKTLAGNYLMSMQGSMPSNDKGGSNPFGNFLVNQYVNKSDMAGKQYVNVDQKEPVQQESGASENINLRGLINTISFVGTPGTHDKPDGIWKTHTNNALKQIAAVASALLQFQAEMKIQVQGYTQKDKEELEANIPANYTDLKGPQDIAARAKNLTANIVQLTTFYQALEKAILNNPKYKPLIEQSQALTSVKPHTATQFTKDEDSFFRSNNQKQIPNVFFQYNGANFPLTFADLSSSTALQAFLKNHKVSVPDSKTLLQILNNIEQQIDAKTPKAS